MKADGQVQLFLGEHELEQADRSLPHGEVCVRTLRSPEKSGSNEDAAALIPLGDSLVLAVAELGGGWGFVARLGDPPR